jgi:hypothetical protein
MLHRTLISLIGRDDAAVGGGGGITLVTSISEPGLPDGDTTGAIDTTGATLLIMAVSQSQGVDAVVSDSKGNTWVALTKHSVAGDNAIRIYYVKNPTVGSGHTFTTSTSSIYSGITAAAFSGTDTTANADGENGATASGAASIQPGSLTPSVNNCLLIAAVSHNVTSVSVNSGFTVIEQEAFVGGNSYGVGLAYKVQTTAGAENPTFTPNASSSMAATIAAFKAV